MKVGFIGVGRMGRAWRAAFSMPVTTSPSTIAPRRRRGRWRRPAQRSSRRSPTCPACGTSSSPCWRTTRPSPRSCAARVAFLPRSRAGAIHLAMGTHGVAVIREVNDLHRAAGQVLVAAPVLGRPDMAASGQLGLVPAGPPAAVEICRPLFAAMGRRVFEAGPDPVAAAAIKVSNNFVLGCAIEAMGEAFSLVRKYGVDPAIMLRRHDRRAVRRAGLQDLWPHHRRRAPTIRPGRRPCSA